MNRKDLFDRLVVEQADVDPREIEVVEAAPQNEFMNPSFQRPVSPVFIKPRKKTAHVLLVQGCLSELY